MGLTLQQTNNMSEQQWDKLKEIMMLHTRLAKEFVNFQANGGSTVEEAVCISKRKSEIKEQIQALRAERDRILAN